MCSRWRTIGAKRAESGFPRAFSESEAARLLAGAERPLIMAANDVNWSGTTDALRHFAEQTGIPVVTTCTARAPSRRTTRSGVMARYPKLVGSAAEGGLHVLKAGNRK